MRTGKFLTIIAFVALFLLMLSALVVSDAPEMIPEPLSPSHLNAQFMPALLPAPDISGYTDMRLHFVRIAALFIFSPALLMLPTLLKRDANGRVLTKERYENSYYQIFRQEVAGG